jgi:hypothetical protein
MSARTDSLVSSAFRPRDRQGASSAFPRRTVIASPDHQQRRARFNARPDSRLPKTSLRSARTQRRSTASALSLGASDCAGALDCACTRARARRAALSALRLARALGALPSVEIRLHSRAPTTDSPPELFARQSLVGGRRRERRTGFARLDLAPTSQRASRRRLPQALIGVCVTSDHAVDDDRSTS